MKKAGNLKAVGGREGERKKITLCKHATESWVIVHAADRGQS